MTPPNRSCRDVRCDRKPVKTTQVTKKNRKILVTWRRCSAKWKLCWYYIYYKWLKYAASVGSGGDILI